MKTYSQDVRHVAETATAVAGRADRIADLAGEVERASGHTAAAEFVRQIRTLMNRVNLNDLNLVRSGETILA